MNFKPDKNEYAEFYKGYVEKVPAGEFLENLMSIHQETEKFIRQISDKWDYRYAPSKWTIKQLVQHMCDAERVFAYRALRFARRDTTELPGFDENSFADHADVDSRKMDDLLQEWHALRESSIAMFRSFDQETLLQTGIASKNKVSVRALAYCILGHELHHVHIIKERYLK